MRADVACAGGFCQTQCPAGTTRCESNPLGCVFLERNHEHCGSCNKTCLYPDETCENGKCVACPPNTGVCPGNVAGQICISFLTDNLNCGQCFKRCADGERCTNGVCGGGNSTTCDNGETFCPNVNACTNTQTSKYNCGYCGRGCGVKQMCDKGKCVTPQARPGQMLCQGQCTDTQTDKNNCGKCKTVCGADQTGTKGKCVTPVKPCRGKQTRCGNGCKDLTRDAGNCGACGTQCNSGLCAGSKCRCCAAKSPEGRKLKGKLQSSWIGRSCKYGHGWDCSYDNSGALIWNHRQEIDCPKTLVSC